MRAIGPISVIVFLAAAAGPASAADAQEQFVRVTPDGDFALGCNTFMVAGWNQCGLLMRSRRTCQAGQCSDLGARTLRLHICLQLSKALAPALQQRSKDIHNPRCKRAT